jgi:hypothetical protein
MRRSTGVALTVSFLAIEIGWLIALVAIVRAVV